MKLLKLNNTVLQFLHCHIYMNMCCTSDLSKLMKTNRTCLWHFLETSSIQMEWLHSESEGNLQISEDTIYEFVPLQRTSLLSAQKGVSIEPAVMKYTEGTKLLGFWTSKVKNLWEAYHKKIQEPHQKVGSTSSYQHAKINYRYAKITTNVNRVLISNAKFSAVFQI